MYNISEFQEFQQKIALFKQKLKQNDKDNFKFCYDKYKMLKQFVVKAQNYFSKFYFLIEFYDLLEIFQNDQLIDDFNQFNLQLLPIIFNNEIYSGVLELTQYSQQEIQQLQEITQKLQNLDNNQETSKVFKNPNDLKLKSSIKRIQITQNNNQKIFEIPYQLCYLYFYTFHLRFKNNGLEICYLNFIKLKSSLKIIKELFIQERALYKLMDLNLQKLRAQKISKWNLIELNVDSYQICSAFKEKIRNIKFDNQEIEYLSKFSDFIKQIKNYDYKRRNILQKQKVYNSHDNQFQVSCKENDYQINFQIKSLIKNEFLYQFQLKNNGLIEVQFSDSCKYYFILQNFNFIVYEVINKTELLNLDIDLNYQEERFANAKFYCNDQKIVIISDLKIQLQSFNGLEFQLDKIISIFRMGLTNEISIIKQDNQNENLIEIIGAICTYNSIYIQINANDGKLEKYYSI